MGRPERGHIRGDVAGHGGGRDAARVRSAVTVADSVKVELPDADWDRLALAEPERRAHAFGLADDLRDSDRARDAARDAVAVFDGVASATRERRRVADADRRVALCARPCASAARDNRLL